MKKLFSVASLAAVVAVLTLATPASASTVVPTEGSSLLDSLGLGLDVALSAVVQVGGLVSAALGLGVGL
ncbi:MAG: hypothetical protein ACRDP8_21570 [Actinopolymorphaceae bacterium]